MALAQIKIWVDGEKLFAFDVDREFNNIYTNGHDLVFPLTEALDFAGFAANNVGGLEMADGFNIHSPGGDINLTDGDLNITKGDVVLTEGDQTLTAGDLTLTSGKLVLSNGNAILVNGALLLHRGTEIASASAINLATATGNYVHITGTAAITELGTVQAGAMFLLEFDGALAFTHDNTKLKLEGGATITTAAGDTALVLSNGANSWKCVSFRKQNGKAVVETNPIVFNPVPRFTKEVAVSQTGSPQSFVIPNDGSWKGNDDKIILLVEMHGSGGGGGGGGPAAPGYPGGSGNFSYVIFEAQEGQEWWYFCPTGGAGGSDFPTAGTAADFAYFGDNIDPDFATNYMTAQGGLGGDPGGTLIYRKTYTPQSGPGVGTFSPAALKIEGRGAMGGIGGPSSTPGGAGATGLVRVVR